MQGPYNQQQQQQQGPPMPPGSATFRPPVNEFNRMGLSGPPQMTPLMSGPPQGGFQGPPGMRPPSMTFQPAMSGNLPGIPNGPSVPNPMMGGYPGGSGGPGMIHPSFPPKGPPGPLIAPGPPRPPFSSMAAPPSNGMMSGPPPTNNPYQRVSGGGMMPGPPPPPGGMTQGSIRPPGMMSGPPPPPGMMSGPPPPPGMMSGPPPPPGMPPMQREGASGGGAQPQRIDPSSIPRPVVNSNMSNGSGSGSAPVIYDTRVLGAYPPPPSAASRYIVRDKGIAGPRFIRSTLSQVPHTAELAGLASMPFNVFISPIALPEPQDDQVQVVDLSEGPIRCFHCKAYMNPFMRFTANGRNFICNICGHGNTTPDNYYCHLGPNGMRRDVDERPELSRGSVEFAATREYMVRPPMPFAHIFMVDASASAVASGALSTACSCISMALDAMPSSHQALVSLATFDSGSIHFYSFVPGSSLPRMFVITDITSEIFVPDSAQLLFPLVANKEALQSLLSQIPTMHNTSPSTSPLPTGSCAGAALEAAIIALQPTGGKVHAFLSTLSSNGAHSFKLRDGAGISEKDKLTVLASQDNTLKSLAISAADFQVCVDILLLAQGYMDIASLSDLTLTTGGTLYQYTPFNPQLDHDQILNDLKWNLIRPQGMEGVMRVRVSFGLEVTGYLGAFYRQEANPTDVYLPAVDSDKSIMATIKHTGHLAPGSECFVQAALLYTTVDGKRRIRVHTLALQVTDSVSTAFKGADLDAQITGMARQLASTLPGGTLMSSRESTTNTTVNTLSAYRKYCASQSSSVQLILPEALKLMPLYALSLLKGPALKDGVRPDDRSLWISQMMSLPCARIAPLLYPRLLALRKALDGSEPIEHLPDGMMLSSEGLEQGGIYLLENGIEALLHVDKNVDPVTLQQILGLSSYDEMLRVPSSLVLVPNDSPASKALQDLLVKVRMHRSSFLRLRVTRKGDLHEASFLTMLVEDRSTAGMSYVEYLCQVHRLIQMKTST